MNDSFDIIPAIDVRDGRVVRLAQGDYAQESRYAASPLRLAQDYADAGASWLHLVDLDAARNGGYTLQALLGEILAQTPLAVQTGGGIRNEADIESLLAIGAQRVVIGTMAVNDPARAMACVRRFGGDRITLALDTRRDDAGNWTLPVHGWTQSAEAMLDGLLQQYADAGARHILCTDISRDGMLSGFNIDLYRSIATRWPQLRVQASGGVRDVADVSAARGAGASAAILGKALLEQRISLAGALAC